MKIKLPFVRVGIMAALFVLLTPLASHAAVNRAVVTGFDNVPDGIGQAYVNVQFYDGSFKQEFKRIEFYSTGVTDEQTYINTAKAVIMSYAGTQSYSIDNVVWPFLDTDDTQTVINSTLSTWIPPALAFNVATGTLALQTSTGAVGTQLSTSTGMWVSVAGQVSTTASIAGNASGDIIIETAATNSATSTDWNEWGRIGNSQALSLAITLQSVQIVKGQVLAYVPAGWYIKARTLGSGTVSYALNTVKKITQ